MYELKLDELYTGKATLIKNKQYYDTKYYVEPFITKMNALTKEFKIFAQMPSQITNSGSVPDLTFNKVLIQAILPKSFYEDGEYVQTINMAYALDVRKPICKFYRTGLNTSNNTIRVFSNNLIVAQDIEPETALDYKGVTNLIAATDNMTVMNKQLANYKVIRNNVVNLLGPWIDTTLVDVYVSPYGSIKLASALPTEVYKKLILDTNSDYYVQPKSDLTLDDVYETFSSIIVEDSKDIINRFEKTILISKLLKLI